MDIDVVEVSSVSRQTRPLSETAAAAFVISAEDLRRSGATNIPEALRMVPGVEVARIDANKWAVSIRGFNGRFADKLLVMIDGMSVYTPFSCNVFWDAQDIPLDDIDRIEVIRGPGGSIWGANAVNGVINIITKNARETQGTLVSVGAGSQPGASGTARYGGQIGDQTFYRAFVRGFAYGDSDRANGGDIAAADGWSQKQSGFRLDTKTAVGDPVTLSGFLYRGNYGTTGVTTPTLAPPYAVRFDDTGDISGASLLGNWQHELSEHSAVKRAPSTGGITARSRASSSTSTPSIWTSSTVTADCRGMSSAPESATASSTTASTEHSASPSFRRNAAITCSRPSSRTKFRSFPISFA